MTDTCDNCTFKSVGLEYCEFWCNLTHVRGTNRACDYFIQRKP